MAGIDMSIIYAGVGMFTAIVLALIAIILTARASLVSAGNVHIDINNDAERALDCSAGGKLLFTLAQRGVFLSSACGGGGTCGQCKVKVLAGGGDVLPTEMNHLNKRQVREGWRLGCQVAVKQDLKIEVPHEFLGVKRWECSVVSNNNVATFIKELVLELPEGEVVNFRAGGFVQLECPPHDVKFSDFDIDAEYRGDWERFGFFKLRSHVRRAGHARLLDGELSRRARHPQIQHPHRDAAAADRGAAAGEDVELDVQPEAGRQGDGVRSVRRVLREGHQSRDGVHRRRCGHGADAIAHLRSAEAHQNRTARYRSGTARDRCASRSTTMNTISWQSREPELQMVSRAVGAAAGGQLDRLHGLHSQRGVTKTT